MPRRPVSTVMSRDVTTLRPDMTLREAERVLASHRVGAAPVVDEAQHVLGVVSQSDLVRLGAKRPSTAAVGAFFTDVEAYRDLAALPADESLVLVEAVMSQDVVTIVPEAPLSEAARRMRERGVHRLLVTTPDGALRGVVSALDLLIAVEEGGR